MRNRGPSLQAPGTRSSRPGSLRAYNDAMAAVQAGDDAAARRFLQEKAERSKKLEAVEQELAEAGQRLKVTRRAVEALEGRVQEVESLIQRSMSMAASDRAQTLSPDSSSSTGSYVDPLEQKFRDMENRLDTPILCPESSPCLP